MFLGKIHLKLMQWGLVIEVDESGNSNQDMYDSAIFKTTKFWQRDSSKIGPQINVDVLENSTVSGLYNHFFKNMKLESEMDSFLKCIKSYFTSMGNEQTWMNDNYGLLKQLNNHNTK